MSYRSSPRPTFTEPAHIPFAAAPRHMWGDEESGQVVDWVYVSSDKIHQVVFALPPGGAFRHSDSYRTIFQADEVYYILSGILVVNNPETGEVHRAGPGEAVFFRRDTWHHGYSYGPEALRVLECFAPPPSQGTSGAYAQSKPNLVTIKTTQDQWLGRWPAARAEAGSGFSMRVLRPHEALSRLEGRGHKVLVDLLVSTEYLTVGLLTLLPGQQSDARRHGGDLALYLLDGKLVAYLPDRAEQSVYELEPGDGFYVPAGIPHHYCNWSERPARAVFGVAPDYLGNA